MFNEREKETCQDCTGYMCLKLPQGGRMILRIIDGNISVKINPIGLCPLGKIPMGDRSQEVVSDSLKKELDLVSVDVIHCAKNRR